MPLLKTIIICFFLVLPIYSAIATPISKDAEISLVTSGPGKEIASACGHSLIRVKDPATQTDIIFTYELTTYNSPIVFLIKGLDGSLKYRWIVCPAKNILQEHKKIHRSLVEQQFLLDEQERQDFLFELFKKVYLSNIKPYKYNILYSNCSTAIWEAIKELLGSNLHFNDSAYRPTSFRQLSNPYLKNKFWVKLLIDITLGMPVDKIATFEEQVCIPDYLASNIAHSFRVSGDGNMHPLLGPKKILVKGLSAGVDNNNNTPFLNKGMIFWILFGFIILLTILPTPRSIVSTVDNLLFASAGLIGLFLLYLWIATVYYAQGNANLNLLWASPLAIIIVICNLLSCHRTNIYIIGLYTLSLTILLVGWPFFPQHFSPYIFPVSVAILIRAVANGIDIIKTHPDSKTKKDHLSS